MAAKGPNLTAGGWSRYAPVQVSPIKRRLRTLTMTDDEEEDGNVKNQSTPPRSQVSREDPGTFSYPDLIQLELEALATVTKQEPDSRGMKTQPYDFHNETTVLIKQENFLEENLFKRSGDWPSSAESSPSDSFFLNCPLDDEEMPSISEDVLVDYFKADRQPTHNFYCSGCGANFYDPCPCDALLYAEVTNLDLFLDIRECIFEDEEDQVCGQSFQHITPPQSPARPVQGIISPQGPGLSFQGTVSPQGPGAFVQGRIPPQEPGLSVPGRISPQGPGPFVQGSISPQRPGSSVQGSISPQRPGSCVKGSISPQTPGSSAQGSISPQRPGSSVQGSISPQRPGSSVQGSISPERPGSSVQGSISPQSPGSSVQGKLSPKRPGSSVQGSMSPQRRGLSIQGTILPQRPSSSVRQIISPRRRSSSIAQITPSQAPRPSIPQMAPPPYPRITIAPVLPPQGHDPFQDIEFLETPAELTSTTPYMREWIESQTEFGIQFYKLNRNGLRHPFIPPLFVNEIRNRINQSQRRFETPNTFFFPTSLLVFRKVMDVLFKSRIPVTPEEPSRQIEHCLRAVRSLSYYLDENITEKRNRAFLAERDDEMSFDQLMPADVIELFKNYSNFYRLRQYQKSAIAFSISRNGRCVFADEEGMGKRVEAMMAACYYRREWPLLIVCATARVTQWEHEVVKYGIKYDRISCYHHGKPDEDEDDDEGYTRADVVIVGYKALQDPAVSKDLRSLEAKVLILDDCHRIKHFNTKTTQNVIEVCRFACRRLFLSPNPTHGTPQEFFQQLHIVDPQAFPNYLEFADQYCGIETTESGALVASRNWRHVRNLEELKHVLYGTVVTRHFRSEKFNLPILEREKVLMQFRPSSRQKRLLGSTSYKDSIDAHHVLENWFEKTGKKKNRTRIFKWYKRSGIAKIIPICAYLDTIDFETEKVIIYARHVKVMSVIETFLERKNVGYVTLEGGDYDRREGLSGLFNVDPEVRVALLSIDLSNYAINLSSATLVIFAELCWVPDTLFRNENRSYVLTEEDVNKNRVIKVKYLVAAEEYEINHIDAVLWEMLLGKMEVLRKLDMLRDPFHVTETEFRGGANLEEYADFSDMSSDERESDEYVPSDEGSEDDEDEIGINTQDLSEEANVLVEEQKDITRSDWPRVFVVRLEDTEWHSYAPERRYSIMSDATTLVDIDSEADFEGSSAEEEEDESDLEFIDDRDADSRRISTSSTNWTISEGAFSEEDETDTDETEVEEEYSESESEDEEEKEYKEIRKKARGFFY